MDPGLQQYINYGLIEEKDIIETTTNDEIVAFTNKQRNFITLDVNMNNSTSASIGFIQDNNKYTCSIEKENENTYIRIRSLNDSTHPINSELKIHIPSNDNNYKVKIVIDNGIIEFFVNDDNSLTGSTGMSSNPYNIYFTGNGNN